MNVGLILALVVLTVVLLTVILRVVARHHSTACPVWLTLLLENPYVEAITGSGALVRRAHIDPGMTVLDVGCGPGRVTLPAAKKVGPSGTVVALDLQVGMIRKLEEKLRRDDMANVQTIVAGIGDGRLPQDTFDRALLVTVLGEIVDREAALQEIHRALKPGGILSVTEALPDPHYQSRRNVRRRVEAAGFEITERFGTWWAFTFNFAKR